MNVIFLQHVADKFPVTPSVYNGAGGFDGHIKVLAVSMAEQNATAALFQRSAKAGPRQDSIQHFPGLWIAAFGFSNWPPDDISKSF